MPTLRDLHIDEGRLRRLIALAREEDLGTAGDITTQAVSPQPSALSQDCSARIVAEQDGVICGLVIVPFILEEMCTLTEPRPSGSGSSPSESTSNSTNSGRSFAS